MVEFAHQKAHHIDPLRTCPDTVCTEMAHNSTSYDGSGRHGEHAGYATLSEPGAGASHAGHADKTAAGHVKITRMAKIVFGIGFCSENMFDVAGDTLLTKFYSGRLQVSCCSCAISNARIASRGCILSLPLALIMGCDRVNAARIEFTMYLFMSS